MHTGTLAAPPGGGLEVCAATAGADLRRWEGDDLGSGALKRTNFLALPARLPASAGAAEVIDVLSTTRRLCENIRKMEAGASVVLQLASLVEWVMLELLPIPEPRSGAGAQPSPWRPTDKASFEKLRRLLVWCSSEYFACVHAKAHSEDSHTARVLTGAALAAALYEVVRSPPDDAEKEARVQSLQKLWAMQNDELAALERQVDPGGVIDGVAASSDHAGAAAPSAAAGSGPIRLSPRMMLSRFSSLKTARPLTAFGSPTETPVTWMSPRCSPSARTRSTTAKADATMSAAGASPPCSLLAEGP